MEDVVEYQGKRISGKTVSIKKIKKMHYSRNKDMKVSVKGYREFNQA